MDAGGAVGAAAVLDFDAPAAVVFDFFLGGMAPQQAARRLKQFMVSSNKGLFVQILKSWVGGARGEVFGAVGVVS